MDVTVDTLVEQVMEVTREKFRQQKTQEKEKLENQVLDLMKETPRDRQKINLLMDLSEELDKLITSVPTPKVSHLVRVQIENIVTEQELIREPHGEVIEVESTPQQEALIMEAMVEILKAIPWGHDWEGLQRLFRDIPQPLQHRYLFDQLVITGRVKHRGLRNPVYRLIEYVPTQTTVGVFRPLAPETAALFEDLEPLRRNYDDNIDRNMVYQFLGQVLLQPSIEGISMQNVDLRNALGEYCLAPQEKAFMTQILTSKTRGETTNQNDLPRGLVDRFLNQWKKEGFVQLAPRGKRENYKTGWQILSPEGIQRMLRGRTSFVKRWNDHVFKDLLP